MTRQQYVPKENDYVRVHGYQNVGLYPIDKHIVDSVTSLGKFVQLVGYPGILVPVEQVELFGD